jgi:hypothetical protein
MFRQSNIDYHANKDGYTQIEGYSSSITKTAGPPAPSHDP